MTKKGNNGVGVVVLAQPAGVVSRLVEQFLDPGASSRIRRTFSLQAVTGESHRWTGQLTGSRNTDKAASVTVVLGEFAAVCDLKVVVSVQLPSGFVTGRAALHYRDVVLTDDERDLAEAGRVFVVSARASDRDLRMAANELAARILGTDQQAKGGGQKRKRMPETPETRLSRLEEVYGYPLEPWPHAEERATGPVADLPAAATLCSAGA